MSVPEETIRREFEDLAARALESGLDLADVERLHRLFDAHPSLEEEWDGLLRTTLLVRDAALSPADFPIEEPGRTRVRQLQPHWLRFPRLRPTGLWPAGRGLPALGAAAVLLLSGAALLWFLVRPSMQQPPGILPTSEVVSIDGLCYHRSGHIKEGSAVPPASAADRGSRCRFRFFYENEVIVDLLGPGRLSYLTQPSGLVLEPHEGTLLVRSQHLRAGGHLSVIAGALRIDSLGTRFRVELQGGERVRVDVTEGTVLLSPLHRPADARKDVGISLPLTAGESWSGSADDHALHGSALQLAPAERARLDALFSATPGPPGARDGALLQTLTTKDGRRYTGTVDQTEAGYRIHTADEVLLFAAEDVRQIDIRIDGEKDPLPQEPPP